MRVSELGRGGGGVVGVYVRRLPTAGTDGGSSNPNLAALTNHRETKLSVLWSKGRIPVKGNKQAAGEEAYL